MNRIIPQVDLKEAHLQLATDVAELENGEEHTKHQEVLTNRLRYEERLLRAASEILGMYSDRKQSEESLKASEERFRQAFENANDGVCIVALDGKFLQVNQRMCEILGYTREELESMTVDDVAYTDDKNLSSGFIQSCLSGQASNLVFEKRYYHKNGTIVWGQISSSIIRTHKGEPLNFISHVQDISKRYEMEEALRQSEVLKAQASLLKDLHDGVGGIAARVGLLAQLALVEEAPEARATALRSIMGLAREMGQEVRRFMSVLEQSDFGWDDWMLEVRTFCNTYLEGLPIELHLDIAPARSSLSIRSDVGLSIYRLIKEGVTNIVKHANASEAWVRVDWEDDLLYVEVRDNGDGFTGEIPRSGGLFNISERVRKLGGRSELLGSGGVAHQIWIPAAQILRPTGDSPSSLQSGGM